MPITVQAWLDRSSIRPKGESRVSVVFEISAHGQVEAGAPRPKSRTVLALDVSLSMRGMPLTNVIKSVERILEAVGEDEEIGVVAFAGGASRVVEPMKTDAAGKRLIRSRVGRLTVDSSTNIEAGLEASAAMLDEARKASSSAPERRSGVILLSDGEPNVGATTPEQFRDVVARHKPGVSFFCLGYGRGTAEDVLSAIGDGWEFVPDPATCARAFARALGSQADIVASDVSLLLAPANGVEILRISGREKMRITKDGLVVSLPDMVHGAKHLVVAELVIKSPGADRFALTLLHATATDKTSRSETDVTTEIADRAPTPISEGARRVLLVRAEEAREEARSLADKGHFPAAAQVLRQVMTMISTLPGWALDDGSPLAEAYELLVDEVMVYERRPDAEQYAMFRKSTVGAGRLTSSSPYSAKARGDASSKLIMHIAGDMPLAWLVNQVGAKYKLEEENVIGRTAEAEIRIQSGAVSRKHAQVFASAGDFWVADLGSTNPTIVNGRPLTSATSSRPAT